MGKSSKIRLDDFLVARGDFERADEVTRAVVAHEVRVGDTYATSSAQLVNPDEDVFVTPSRRFVSRGGQKLQAALEAFNQDVRGLQCLDIGSSTGGFTDCLLQAGAASVVCVDVNYGQLAWEVRTDERVRVFERTNIRYADPSALGAPFDLIVIDVSFIGLAQLVPCFPPLCHEGTVCDDVSPDSEVANNKETVLIALIKPQFESRRGESDHGVVRDESVRVRTVDEVASALVDEGFQVTGTITSPICGAAGNVEYLMRAVYRPEKDDQ